MRKLIFIILALIIILAPLINATQICSLCGKTISGSYVKFTDGSVYCQACMDMETKCAICGKPSKSIVQLEGKSVCRQCLPDLNRCSFCNKPLTGEYINYPDLKLKLCVNCSKTIPRCDFCGKPDNNLMRAGDKNLCRTCYSKSDFCFICGEPIEGEFMWFDGDDSKKYCNRCVNRYPKCASCGAPAGKNMHKLDDNRILCRACYRSGYFNPEPIGVIKRKILDFLDTSFNMTIKHKVRYSLQGQDFIKSKSGAIAGDLNGLFHREKDEFEIFVLYGLRQKDLYQVISHEIAHAWASENCRPNLTAEESEGFAQWIAYYTLIRFGFYDFGQTLTAGDNVYARGLRKMLETEKRGGREAVFRSLTK